MFEFGQKSLHVQFFLSRQEFRASDEISMTMLRWLLFIVIFSSWKGLLLQVLFIQRSNKWTKSLEILSTKLVLFPLKVRGSKKGRCFFTTCFPMYKIGKGCEVPEKKKILVLRTFAIKPYIFDSASAAVGGVGIDEYITLCTAATTITKNGCRKHFLL